MPSVRPRWLRSRTTSILVAAHLGHLAHNRGVLEAYRHGAEGGICMIAFLFSCLLGSSHGTTVPLRTEQQTDVGSLRAITWISILYNIEHIICFAAYPLPAALVRLRP